ncbi:MAPEG family protein [Lysobacter humi (ex Lee et al. 2017)]
MPVVTLLIAGLHGLLLLALLWPIVRVRRGRKIGLGDGGDPELLRRIRVHANFIENVPFALVLLALLELGGLAKVAVAALGLVLLGARLAHAAGLGASAGYSKGRFWGTLLTWIVVLVGSLLAILSAAIHLGGSA